MSSAVEDAKRIKELVNDILVSMYGLYNVFKPEIERIQRKNNNIIVNGIFYEDWLETTKYKFDITFDSNFRLLEIYRYR